jgi:hypothetical protein
MDKSITPDAGFDEKIAGIMNVEASLRVLAVRSMLADWDTIGIGNGQNAYLYYAPIEGRHYLIPWDMDHTFERTDVAIAPGAGTTGFNRIISRPVYRRTYARILSNEMKGAWSDAHLNVWTQKMSVTTTPAFVAAAATNVAFIRTRRAQVTAYIKTGTGMPFAITTPNPSAAKSGTLSISGTAPVDVAQVLVSVNGKEPVEPPCTWTTPPRQTTVIPTIWQITVDGLTSAENTVDVYGLDGAGFLFGSGSLRVMDASAWIAPTVSAITPASGPLSGGTPVTIQGSGFQTGARVLFGNAAATSVEILSGVEMQAVTPASPGQATVDVAVVNLDDQRGSLASAYVYADEVPSFVRADVDGSAGVTITDVVTVLDYLFRRGSLSCLDAADVNDDGKVNTSDAVFLLLYLFAGHAPPPPPFGTPGVDPTPDALGCVGG